MGDSILKKDSQLGGKKSPVMLISTILVELTLLVVLGHPNSTVFRAPVLIIAFLWTIIRRCKKNDAAGRINAIHLLWALSTFALVNFSVLWAIEPQGVDDVRNNVMWSVMTSIIVADYVSFYKITVNKVIKLLVPIAVFFIINTLLFGTVDESNRLSMSNNANVFGTIAIGMLCFFLYSLFKEKKKRPLYIVLSIVLLILGLMSGSRKAIISLVVYFVSFFLFIKPKKNTRKTFVKLVIAIGVVFASYELIMNVKPLYDTIGNRVETLLEVTTDGAEADASINSRINMVNLASGAIKKNLVLGIGANNVKYYTYYGTYAHNGYVEVMCDFGIIGVIIYYLPLLWMLIMSIKKWRMKYEDAIVPLSILVAFFICEIANVTYFSMSTYCFIGIAAGLSQLMKNDKEKLGEKK